MWEQDELGSSGLGAWEDWAASSWNWSPEVVTRPEGGELTQGQPWARPPGELRARRGGTTCPPHPSPRVR